jgi:hypothetical protein
VSIATRAGALYWDWPCQDPAAAAFSYEHQQTVRKEVEAGLVWQAKIAGKANNENAAGAGTLGTHMTKNLSRLTFTAGATGKDRKCGCRQRQPHLV